MLENPIQKSILDYLGYKREVYFFRSGCGAIKTEEGRYFKTGKKGCPDITICYKGRFIGLEVKSAKGKQDPSQKKAEQEILKAGGEYYIVRSIDDVKKIVG